MPLKGKKIKSSCHNRQILHAYICRSLGDSERGTGNSSNYLKMETKRKTGCPRPYEADSDQTACAAQAIPAIQISESLICEHNSYSIEDIIDVKMPQNLKIFSASLWLYIKEVDKMSRA